MLNSFLSSFLVSFIKLSMKLTEGFLVSLVNCWGPGSNGEKVSTTTNNEKNTKNRLVSTIATLLILQHEILYVYLTSCICMDTLTNTAIYK